MSSSIQWIVMIVLLIGLMWKIQSPPRTLNSGKLKRELQHRLRGWCDLKHTRERQYILADICEDREKDDAYLATAEFLLRDDPQKNITKLFKRRLPLDEIFQSESVWAYLSASRQNLYGFFKLAQRFPQVWSWVKRVNFNKEGVSKSDGDYLELAKFLIFYKHETNDAIVNLFKISSLPSLDEIFQSDAVLVYLNHHKRAFFELAQTRSEIWPAFKLASNQHGCDDEHDGDYLAMVIFLLPSDHKTDEIQDLLNVTKLPSLREILQHDGVVAYLNTKLPAFFDLAKHWTQIFSTLKPFSAEPLCSCESDKDHATVAEYLVRNGADFKVNSMPKPSAMFGVRLTNGNTTLHQCAQATDIATRSMLCRLLCAHGRAAVLVNEENSDGDTALHLICKKIANSKVDQHPSWLNWILNIPGLDVNKQNKDGDTPAHIACRHFSSSPHNFGLLLTDERVSRSIENKKGETPESLMETWPLKKQEQKGEEEKEEEETQQKKKKMNKKKKSGSQFVSKRWQRK